MALGSTLGELISGVQDEVISSSNPALGQNMRPIIKSRIIREATRLHADFNWPHLINWFDKASSAGQRYYDWPDGVVIDTVIAVYYRWGSRWMLLDRNLDVGHYNSQDSDAGYRADPAYRWRPKGAQFEIHPVPATSSNMRIVAKSPLSTMVSEADTCNIDDQLVILFSAAKLLARRSASDAGLVLAEANAHYATLKQRQQEGAETFNFAAGGEDRPSRIGFADKIIVGVGGA